ncbi:hypothetical protein SAMN04515679_1627 [Pelosinus fermentans]|jgi:hypothetical protein|uniref:Uncharacterized protein n=2 Tax=Sporomusaceae TaxID=1843490 RepID=I9LJ71_9FIRM|nr:hypothetical protein [Pelosinus fermentans]EIW20466.1 hypothetical protein FB4_2085 [Pelosinus fermentans B4]EIW25819.1 hypothetical protein FA11_2441 [Pelosinus fermentans A11]OAM93543.1 hypothetical protein FR7_01559 [Pelosinus fermentans DSM 17108]SDQ81412.1 hypothetical protein SAMN04515679_1627 [Pelosinus fermentans]
MIEFMDIEEFGKERFFIMIAMTGGILRNDTGCNEKELIKVDIKPLK